ncbi:SDR family oxidoreductase [Martelella alba]|uniref:SDR family oxidoreductase n=1 Tax=Martelella alba TaxID=2590451 RepID=A0A506UGB3_9HYPH|nr:SDR family oxidoreductase [Martelella alba]TPW32441.1 SDR family oxidoreductase [Martelella alba]
MHLMIFGAGYSGKEIGRALAPNATQVAGTIRSANKAGELADCGMEAFIFDGETMDPALRHKLRSVTHIVQTIPPGDNGDPLLRAARGATRQDFPSLQWIGYLSTIGVYGDHKGAWIDETAQCRPTSLRSQLRYETERAWLQAGANHCIPVAIMRLSGIYGPGRNVFLKLQDGTSKRVIKKGQIFNRVRVEDVGFSTAFLAEHGFGGVFNITDDEPAPPQDVIVEAARLMGIDPPPEIAFEDAEMSEMARSFWGDSKRVSNKKICDLGYEFEFPNYRQSLKQMWELQRHTA